ncbi:MAG: response regulator [Candidatus Magnetomorum sp.]|nr:response regulator [Candidatus Magnetomorum sp.]
MAIRILVVHEYTVIQKIAQNYILTEYSDAIVNVFSSTLDAIEELKTIQYDIVLCAMEMYGMDGLAFSEAILQTINKDTNFIIMTSNYDEKNIISLKQMGIKHVLSIPFTQPQLRAFINDMIKPRAKRIFERFIVQDTHVLIPVKGQTLTAQLINIGMNGFLCELTFNKTCNNILESNLLALKFPEAFGNITAHDITVSLMRISVSEWDSKSLPETIRIAYRFVQMPPASKKIIQKAIKISSNELTMAESQALIEILGE